MALAGVLLSAAGCSTAGLLAEAPPAFAAPAEPVLLADFNEPRRVTNLGTPYGAWDSDPGDQTQFCRARLVERPRVGEQGYSLMIDYDVDSPNPAFNGVWMQLPSLDLSGHVVLSFMIRGDADRGFTRRVKIELKDGSKSATYLLDGITAEWARQEIPLQAFEGMRRLRRLQEFVIVFEDGVATEKTGTVYLDEVRLE